MNPTGSAALATAGTGDVLSGMIGSFIAQGYDLTTAVLGAVWLHGAAAQCATMPVLADELSSRRGDRSRHASPREAPLGRGRKRSAFLGWHDRSAAGTACSRSG